MRIFAHSYTSWDEAVCVVQALEAAGILHDDISLVSAGADWAGRAGAAGRVAGAGAAVGTVLGGGAGLLAGLGSLAIPGVGPIVAAGWLIAALTGAGVGAATGGLLGSLTGAGVDEAEATRLAEHVGQGGTLVTLRASDALADEAEHILHHGMGRPTNGPAALGAVAGSP